MTDILAEVMIYIQRQRQRRSGLLYVRGGAYGTPEVFICTPRGPFTVDGIRYERSGCHRQPMITLKEDAHSGDSFTYNARARPLTDDQVDRYLGIGRYAPPRIPEGLTDDRQVGA